jgi:hypothetical protein
MRDLISISLLNFLYITLRLHRESNIGFRSLGSQRYSIDLTYVSIVVEKYWYGEWWK